MAPVGACRLARRCATSPPRSPAPGTARRSPPMWATGSSTCQYPLERDATVRIVTPRQPGALELYRHSTAHLLAAAVTTLFPGTQCGIGPATEEGFFYDFVVERPFVPGGSRGDRSADERAGRSDSSTSADDAERGGRSVLRRARRAAQGATDSGEEADRDVSCYTIKTRRPSRLLRRPACALDGQAQGVQAAEHVERLLEGRCAQPADAADLRDGLLQGRGTKAHLSRSKRRRSATIASSDASSVSSCSTRGRRARRSGSPRGRRSTTRSPNYMREVLFPAGYVEVKTPLIYNKALWETSGHWSHYRAEHVPHRVRRRADGR